MGQREVLEVLEEFYPYALRPAFIAKLTKIRESSIIRNITRLRTMTPYIRLFVYENRSYYTLTREAVKEFKEMGSKKIGKKAKEIHKYGNEPQDFISFFS